MSLPGSNGTPLLPTIRTLPTPERWSDGPRFGRRITAKLNRVPTRWQQYVLDVALERTDGPTSPFAYSDVICIVGRRGGKTVNAFGVPLARALDGPVRLDNGVVVPFLGAHMAQNLVKAKKRFMADLIEPYRADLPADVWRRAHHLRSALGDTSFTLDPLLQDYHLRRSSMIDVAAPTASSLRGDGLLHLTLDEFLVFTREQGAGLLAAAGPTMSSLRGHAQIWMVSNISAETDSRMWAWELRDRGRAAVAAGANTGTAYFEFTMPDDADPTDERLWPVYYPGINDGLVRFQELRSELARLGVTSFAAEYFSRWPGKIVARKWSTILEADWSAAGTDDIIPDAAPAAIGVDIDPRDGRASSISAAAIVDDRIVVELLAHAPGADWVLGELERLAPGTVGVGVDDYGPGRDLIEQIRADHPALTDRLVTTQPQDFYAACYAFDAGIREAGILVHRGELYDTLTAAAEAAERTTGRAWQWERRVGTSQTPIVSATLAVRALSRRPDLLPDPEIF